MRRLIPTKHHLVFFRIVLGVYIGFHVVYKVCFKEIYLEESLLFFIAEKDIAFWLGYVQVLVGCVGGVLLCLGIWKRICGLVLMAGWICWMRELPHGMIDLMLVYCIYVATWGGYHEPFSLLNQDNKKSIQKNSFVMGVGFAAYVVLMVWYLFFWKEYSMREVFLVVVGLGVFLFSNQKIYGWWLLALSVLLFLRDVEVSGLVGTALLLLFLFHGSRCRLLETRSRRVMIFYDGDCLLCHRSVDFLLAEDNEEVIRYASLWEETASKTFVLPQDQEKRHIEDTIVVCTMSGRYCIRSEALLYLCLILGGVWQYAIVSKILPRWLRDGIYLFISQRRRALFGRGCRLRRNEQKRLFYP